MEGSTLNSMKANTPATAKVVAETSKADDKLFDMVDTFINLANTLANEHPVSHISAAIMYAAATYNAFNLSKTHNPEDIGEECIRYYVQQYMNGLLLNIEEQSK